MLKRNFICIKFYSACIELIPVSYQFFENYEPAIFHELAKLFSKTALEVCDGQQLDVDFETRNDVTIDEYIEMIRLKTSV